MDAFEDRLTPSATATAPDPAYADSAAAVAAAQPYVFIDFDACDTNKDGRVDGVTQFRVDVTSQDGATVSVLINVRPGQTSASVALAVVAALRAEGVECSANGSAVEIHGHLGSEIEDVRVQVTGTDGGADDPGLRAPHIEGHNGATASSVILLPK